MGSIEDVIKAAEEIQSQDINVLKELKQLNAKVDLIYEETKKTKYGYMVNIFLGLGFALVGVSVGYVLAGGSVYNITALLLFVLALFFFASAIAIQQKYFSFTEALEELSNKK